MNEKVSFIYNTIKPPKLSKPPVALTDTICALTGEEIKIGYPAKVAITNATSEVAETFRYPSNHISVQVAELFRAQKVLRGNLICYEGQLLNPLVSKESATAQLRPCWRDLIYSIPIGTQCLCVFSDESKRRCWHKAMVSTYGKNWRPFMNGSVVKSSKFKSPELSRSLEIHVDLLKKCLSLVESTLAFGFSKIGIYRGILNESNKAAKIGLNIALKIEKQLGEWRDTDEFQLSLFIAQIRKD